MALNPDYATLDDLRAYMRVTDAADTVDDARASLALTAASRAIDDATDRQFGLAASAVARYYKPVFSDTYGRWVAEIDDVMTITGLVVKSDIDGDAVYEATITDHRLWPLNAAGDGRPWEQLVFGPSASFGYLEGSLELTARWGWTSVPDTIKNATMLQALRFYKRRDSPFGIAGSPDMGNELRLLAKVDPDVAVMVHAYRRWFRA